MVIDKNNRLEEVRVTLNVNKSELARRIDSPQSHISKALKGEVTIGSYLSDKIVKRLRLNPVWWESGEGGMFLADPEIDNVFEADKTIISNNITSTELNSKQEVVEKWLNVGPEAVPLPNGMLMMSMPLVDQYSYASYLSNWQEVEFLQTLPRHAVIVPKHHSGKCIAFEVRGSSMDDNTRNAICAGDIVVGRAIEQAFWHSKFHLHRFEDYVIVHQEGILTKRISEHNVDEGLITCLSTNPDKQAYPDLTIQLADVYEIYNIVSVTQKRGRR